jgi:type VI secretion system protein ImpH
MPTPYCDDDLGLIRQLFEAPYQFDFFQAVRLLEQWLGQNGLPCDDVLKKVLRFRNSLAMNFPASAIEALHASHGEGDGVDLDAIMDSVREQGDGVRFDMTPTFIGLLGVQGALPLHYSERIATHQQSTGDEGARAFLDLFSNRLVALFYKAWLKHRLELADGERLQDRQLPLLLSLIGDVRGGASKPVADDVAAFYAGALRQRPCSPAAMQSVLNDYFRVPVRVEPLQGGWQALAPALQAQLGGKNACLGERCVLGSATWRRDLRVQIRLGPLSKAQFDHFLPDSAGARALKNLLSMFAAPTLQFEIRLILRAEDVRCAVLGAAPDAGGARLGLDVFLAGPSTDDDRDDLSYALDLL